MTNKSTDEFNRAIIYDGSIKSLDNIRHVQQFSTIQEAINRAGVGTGKVVVTEAEEADYPIFTAPLDVSCHSSIVEGMGRTHILNASDGTTMDVTAQDVTIRDMWVDNIKSTGHAIDTYSETFLSGIDVDESPNHGIYSNAADVTGSNIWFTNGPFGGSCLVLGAGAADNTFTNVNVGFSNDANDPTHGLLIDGNRNQAKNVTITGVTGTGLVVNGTLNTVSGKIQSAGNHGVEVTANYNILETNVRNPTNNALVLTGASQNVIRGVFHGDIVIDSNSNNNSIIGRCTGAITDNGTGNDTSNVV